MSRFVEVAGRLKSVPRILLALTPLFAVAQTTCPAVNFLTARTVNLKPTANSHIDVVRQADGSYTGYEVTDAAPYRTIAVTPHFEKQFSACLPHAVPASPATAFPSAYTYGETSRFEVAFPLASGGYFEASVDGILSPSVHFDRFDSAHNLIDETNFSYSAPEPFNPFPRIDSFTGLNLTDMNGDGRPDLIAVFNTNRENGRVDGGVWIFPGNGDGTFQSGRRTVFRYIVPVNALFAANSVQIADIDGDGKPDVILAGKAGLGSFNSDLVIAFGNGDGTLKPDTRTITNFVDTQFALADLDGDGKADLISLASHDSPATNALSVAHGNGDGTFQAAVMFSGVPSGNGPIAVGDVNGDGKPDIVASGTILFGDGKGGFPSRRIYSIGAIGSVGLADFDGDGKVDIIVGNGNALFLSGTKNYPSVTVLLGQGGGTFTGAPLKQADVGSYGGLYPVIASADFNGDGFADVVVASGSGTQLKLSVLAGGAAGEFSVSPTQLPASPLLFGIGAAIAADFNHDGKPDLALIESGQIQIFPGSGDGTFAAPFLLIPPDGNGRYIRTPDLNQDGIPDLALASLTGVSLWLGKGDGTFPASPTYTVTAASPAIAFGDFNGDGKVDLAIAYQGTARIDVFPGTGDGKFGTPVTGSVPSDVIISQGEIMAADFDLDGKLDLAVQAGKPQSNPFNVITSEIVLLAGRGDGTFSRTRVSPGSLSPIAATDMNRDGIPDLVGGQAIRLGNGDGTFQDAIAVEGAFAPLVADLNGDGAPDLLSPQAGSFVASFINLSQAAAPLTVVSAASFMQGPLAPGSIAAAFGAGLAPVLAVGELPLPTVLAGVGVTVQDSAGVIRQAPLYFVSPGQINFLVPSGTRPGAATITVRAGIFGQSLSSAVQIDAAAPALFTVGSGVAAAVAIAVAADGTQTVLPVFAIQDGVTSSVPVDVSQGRTFLILFGTGLDAGSTDSTTAHVQGLPGNVAYAGPQTVYAGLDQINVLLPPSLAGTGLAAVTVTVQGKTSNKVYVMIQ